MEYTELTIRTDKQHLDILEAELIDRGFTSMMIDDPDVVKDIIEHPDVYRYDYLSEELTAGQGRTPSVTLYFTDDEEGLAELRRAKEIIDGLSAGGMSLTYEDSDAGDDSEWLYKWQEHFKPARVGDRIVVKPSWEEYEPAAGDLVIEMDPGMAFGSGLHETTSLCIRALEKILRDKAVAQGDVASVADGSHGGTSAMTDGGPRGLRILDVGTGTGILAIAGVLLGAEEALGIDIDPEAVRVAGENIAKNGMSERITAQYGDLTEGVDYQADILVANLMADLVIRFSPAAADHLGRGGWYITSGILDIKEEPVCKAISEAGFAIEEVMHDGEWCAVIARKA